MEDLQLTETEQRYFGDLFLMCCGTENTGKVPLFKACELFRTSKVPPDIIKQVTMHRRSCKILKLLLTEVKTQRSSNVIFQHV